MSLRLWTLASCAWLLAAFNAVAWVPNASRSDGCSGCKGSVVQGPVTAEDLLVRMDASVPRVSGQGTLPPISCSNCSYIQSMSQVWCVLRPPNTDCTPGTLFDNNYRRVRAMRTFDCGGGRIAICCTPWVDDGCCNYSSLQPPCEGGGAQYHCSEKTCPEP